MIPLHSLVRIKAAGYRQGKTGRVVAVYACDPSRCHGKKQGLVVEFAGQPIPWNSVTTHYTARQQFWPEDVEVLENANP